MKGKVLLAVALIMDGLASAPLAAADLEKIEALADRGRAEEALRVLEDQLLREPAELEGRFLRGVLLAEVGRNSDAERAFHDLSREFPDRPEPTHNLAVLQAASGRRATAIVALEEILSRYPGYEAAARNLERIRSGAAGDDFDPLSPDASRVQLVLTTSLGSYPRAEPPAEPAPAVALAQPATRTSPAAEAEVEPAPAVIEVTLPPEPEVTAPAAIETALDREPEAAAPGAIETAPDLEPEAAAPTATEAAPEPEPQTTAPATIEAVPEPRPVEPAASTPEGATAAEPEPTPVADPAPAAGDLRADLERVVAAWAEAWSQQRVREYLGFYATDFEPTGFPSRDAWESVRRQRVAAPSFIEVEVDLDSMTVRETGPGEASATFVQRYHSDRYGDTVQKTLGFVREDGIWRIRTETSR